jgi:hypothetical protein
MAAFDFPSNPNVGDPFTPAGSDITYTWTGVVWNASVSAGSVGVTLVESGSGITTTPLDGIVATGSVAVDNTVLRTTGAQTKTGALTDADGFIGPLTGAVTSGQYILTNNVDGSGIQIGSVVSSSSKYTISTTANAISTQFIGAANQYVDIVSNTDTYARFNNATQALMIGGTIPDTPGITLAGTTVTATTFAGNSSTTTKLATPRDITVTLTGNVTGSNTTSFDGSSNITISVPATLSSSIIYWDRDGTVLSPSNAGDNIYTSGDVFVGGTSTSDATIELDGATGIVTAVQFKGDGSLLTGLPRSVVFKGTINATTGTAPTDPDLGDLYINTTAGNLAATYTPINGDAIAVDQFLFYAADAGLGEAGWVLGGVQDVSQYVTLSTDQTISGNKTFTAAVAVGPADNDIRTRLYANGGVSTPLQTITASAFDLTDGVNWTVGAVTVPNPTNGVAGMAGSIIVTAAPTGWGANYKFPSPDNGVTDGTAPALANFPVVLPYIVQNPTTILIGNPTIY